MIFKFKEISLKGRGVNFFLFPPSGVCPIWLWILSSWKITQILCNYMNHQLKVSELNSFLFFFLLKGVILILNTAPHTTVYVMNWTVLHSDSYSAVYHWISVSKGYHEGPTENSTLVRGTWLWPRDNATIIMDYMDHCSSTSVLSISKDKLDLKVQMRKYICYTNLHVLKGWGEIYFRK